MRFLATGLRIVTAAYAVVLVMTTHIPRLHVPFGIATPLPADKLLHFAAYGVLGFLVGLISAEARLNPRRIFPRALAVIAAFALLDETTQPIFGRATEPFDWVADLMGACAGFWTAAGLAAAARILALLTKSR